MKRIFLGLGLLLNVFIVSSQGFIFSTEEELNSFEQLTDQTFGFTADIPSRYSFEKYVPPVLEQEGGTCLGYAMSYYALSTMYNIEFGITSYRGKIAHSFDPYFIYTIANNENANPCDEGLDMTEASYALKNLGAKKMFYPPFLSCGTRWTDSKKFKTFKYTKPYAIKGFKTAPKDRSDFIELAKQTLYRDIPIISGFNITESLNPMTSSNPNGVNSSGLWQPNDLEDSIGGHAMTLIGYDDYKYGGAFRVVNSWGTDYGDNGFIWIKYEDWEKYARQSHILELNENLITTSSEFDLYQDDYVRFEKNYGTYEGQSSNGGINGLGIFYDYDDDTHYIGNYTQSTMDGKFIFLDTDGLFSSNIVNGKFQDINQLGFSGGPDFEIMNDSINKYLSEIGIKYKIRKANSTKKFSTNIED